MKFRLLAAIVACASTTIAAHAQAAGVYVNPIAYRISTSIPDTGAFAFLGSGKTSQMFYGISFGGYYQFAHQDKLDISIDLRDSIVHGNSASLNNFLVGPRVSVSPFSFPLHPYAQISVGVGTSRPPTNALHTSKVEFGAFAGADYKLNHRFDWRVIEVGYGSVQTISSSLVGASTIAIPSARLLSFSTSFVLRFP
jgi:hypothetical protein